MKMQFWAVFLHGHLIDEVPYTEDCDKEYVKKTLIEHDGYSCDIEIEKC